MIVTAPDYVLAWHPRRVLEATCYNPGSPMSLRPCAPALLLDRRYTLFAAGLLVAIAPRAAAGVTRRHLTSAEEACDVV